MTRKLFLLLLLPTLDSNLVYGQEPSNIKKSPDDIPTIEEIKIKIHPVFDESNPKENNAIFRMVNRLHINTKKQVIEKDLTFKKGDQLDKYLLQESERRLRERHYFSKAKITSVSHDKSTDAKKEVQVDVQEVWTLVPKVTYSNSGGSTHYGYGLHDSNFLGLGKSVKIEQSSSRERDSNILAYRDPNFFSDNQLNVSYSDNSDGKEQKLLFSKPFRSLRTPWTAGIDLLDFEREDTLFNAGDEAWRFGHKESFSSLFYGRRLDISTDTRTRRWTLGWDRVNDTFYSVPTELLNVYALPTNRKYDIVWLEYSYLHNQFLEATNIQQINRTEDINLGSEWHARIGNVISDDEPLDQSILVQMDYSKSYLLSPHQLLTGTFSTSGFYSGGQSLNSISKIDLGYHWTNLDHGQFYILVNETSGNHLFEDTPIELGGDTGIRGYPTRFMAGDHSRLLTVEQRFFGETEWFSLFHLGSAIFYDQGKVWGDVKVPQNYQQTLRDVGFGLRLSGTRTGGQEEGSHNIVHIDIAFPLDGGEDVDSYLISAKIKTSF